MRRIVVVLCMIVSAGACVNLDKPKKVAECSANENCVNSPKRIDAAPLDSPKGEAGGTIIEGPYPKDAADTAKPRLDGATGNDDTAVPPVNDDGGSVIPDGQDDVPSVISPDGPSIGQPDLPDDAPPIIISDDAPIVTPDGPVVPQPDGPADTRGSDRPRDISSPDVLVGICASNGVLKPAGTVCRAAVGDCDIAESCDGLSADCPADKVAAAGKECRASAGDCDIAETCSGTSNVCPEDGLKQAGTVCRVAAGLCDYAEVCSGASAACPSDSLKQSSSVCRDATNVCDPPESCTGLSASCPQDVPPYTRPTAPATVNAAPGELQATVTWSAVSGATAYNVKRSNTAGGPYTTVATGLLTASYVDTGLDSNKTYYYVISAVDTIAACESAANSPEASVKPTGVCVKPSAPAVTATAGNGQVTLSWAAITGATAYAIDRSEASGTGYASLASVTAPTTTYVDLAVVFGKTYYYKVTTKGTCDSDASTEVFAAPLCAPAAAAPTGLAASAPNTGGVVLLTWNAVAGAKTTDRYYIMRKLSTAGNYTKIDEVLPPTISYSDTTATNGTAYNYAITYYNGTCTSGNSNVATATAACVMDKPVLTVAAGNKKVDLSWTAPSNGSLSGFEVYRKDTGSYAKVATLTGAGSTTYSDTGLTNNTTYTYYVRAIGNCNADSDPKTAAPICTPLAAPTNLKATAGDTQATLGWDAVTGADHYTVKRGAATGGPYTALTPASPITTNSYTDTGLTNGTPYFYVVTVSNGTCDSANSGEATTTPQTCPSQGAPGKPTLSITPTTQVKVDWTAATPAPPNGYNILRSTTPTGTYASVGSVLSTVVTFTDSTSLTVGTTYYYQVKAVGASCASTSASTSIALVCSNPTAPSPGIVANTDGTIDISWALATGATAYTVSRGTATGGPYTPITAATNITALTYRDSGLTNAANYYYVVTATNAGGQCSAVSGEVTKRSCIIPAAPTSVTARRSGNKQVTVVWTNSTNATVYNVQRSTTSGSGYASVGTAAGSPYPDTTAANNTAYYYVVTAASDASSYCSSGNSVQASAPSCYVMGSGESQRQLSAVTTEWCVISCNDISSPTGSGYAKAFNCGSRGFYFNGATATCNVDINKPAKANGGYAYYFTAASDGGYVGAQWGNGTNAACP